MNEENAQETEVQQELEITLEVVRPCKWLSTHNVEYAKSFDLIRKNGGSEFDLGILKLLSEGRVEIVPGILGEFQFVSSAPN